MAGIRDLSRRAGLKPEQVVQLFDAMTAMMEEGQTVNIRGFGSFTPVITEPREVTSPVLPGGKGRVPRRRTVKLSIFKELKDKWVMEEQG